MSTNAQFVFLQIVPANFSAVNIHWTTLSNIARQGSYPIGAIYQPVRTFTSSSNVRGLIFSYQVGALISDICTVTTFSYHCIVNFSTNIHNLLSTGKFIAIADLKLLHRLEASLSRSLPVLAKLIPQGSKSSPCAYWRTSHTCGTL